VASDNVSAAADNKDRIVRIVSRTISDFLSITATALINLYIIDIGDCPISVDRDSHQMQYRGCAAQNVAAGPHVAELRTEWPCRVYLQ